MRRQLTGALVATAALLLPATAVAQSPQTQPPTTTTTTPSCTQNCGERLTVDPNRAAPGDRVAIYPWCGGAPAGKPESRALTGFDARHFFWHATVRNVAPGQYPVTVACPTLGRTLTATLTVLASPAPAPPKQEKPQVPVKPKGAPQTGGGGTA